MRIKTLLLALMAALSLQAQEITPSDRPNKTQQLQAERGYGMFIHFGMNTFIEKEWSEGVEPASTYHPTALDPDQWVRVARDAGFRYVLLVTKHHDGFCLWDSKYTDYDVASSPVPVDVVRGVSDACKKYGLKFAVYYSLWDRHEKSYQAADFNEYIDFMENQLRELLTQYGEVCELWLDGGWDKPARMWQIPRLYKIVKELQPHCAFGVNNGVMLKGGEDGGGFDSMANPDQMTAGYTNYLRYFPMDFRLADPKIANKKDKKLYTVEGKQYYLPFEHTICVSRAWNWFQKERAMEVRSLDELEELFYWSTENGNSLVINVGPDRRGLIRANEEDVLVALKDRLGLKKGKPLPRNGEYLSVGVPAEASSTFSGDVKNYGPAWAVDGGMQTRWASGELTPELVLTFDSEQEFNKISIFEYQDTKAGEDGFSNYRENRIKEYRIDIWKDNAWENIYISSEPMGDCKQIHFPRNYMTSRLRFKVLRASDFPSLWEFNVIRMPK